MFGAAKRAASAPYQGRQRLLPGGGVSGMAVEVLLRLRIYFVELEGELFGKKGKRSKAVRLDSKTEHVHAAKRVKRRYRTKGEELCDRKRIVDRQLEYKVHAPPSRAARARVHLSATAQSPRWTKCPLMIHTTASAPAARRVSWMWYWCPLWKGLYSAMIAAVFISSRPFKSVCKTMHIFFYNHTIFFIKMLL